MKPILLLALVSLGCLAVMGVDTTTVDYSSTELDSSSLAVNKGCPRETFPMKIPKAHQAWWHHQKLSSSFKWSENNKYMCVERSKMPLVRKEINRLGLAKKKNRHVDPEKLEKEIKEKSQKKTEFKTLDSEENQEESESLEEQLQQEYYPLDESEINEALNEFSIQQRGRGGIGGRGIGGRGLGGRGLGGRGFFGGRGLGGRGFGGIGRFGGRGFGRGLGGFGLGFGLGLGLGGWGDYGGWGYGGYGGYGYPGLWSDYGLWGGYGYPGFGYGVGYPIVEPIITEPIVEEPIVTTPLVTGGGFDVLRQSYPNVKHDVIVQTYPQSAQDLLEQPL